MQGVGVGSTLPVSRCIDNAGKRDKSHILGPPWEIFLSKGLISGYGIALSVEIKRKEFAIVPSKYDIVLKSYPAKTF